MRQIKLSKNIPAVLLIFLLMILSAYCDNVKGVFIPAFKTDFKVDNTSIGIMITIGTLGCAVFSYVGGVLCERVGQKKVFIIGLSIVGCSLIMLRLSTNFIVLVVGMFFLNMGQAFGSIATNTLIPVLFLSFQAVIMNITHFCYGLGSSLAQKFSGAMLYNGTTWRQIYLYIAISAFILLTLFVFVKIPQTHKMNYKEAIGLKDICHDKLIYYYVFALGFYVFAEMGTGNWFVNFMEKVYNYNKSQSSSYVALFFAVFAIGRLLGGFIVQKFGYVNTVGISMVMAVVMYTTGIALGEKGLILIALAGLFFLITYPTLILSVSTIFKQSSLYITGVIITFCSLTSTILNLIFGYLIDKIGAYNAFYMIPASLFISIIFIYLIKIYSKANFAISNK